MKISRFGAILISCWLLLSAGNSVLAQTTGRQDPVRKKAWAERQEKMLDALHVSPLQKDQLAKNRESHKQAAEALRAQIKIKREQLTAALQKPDMSEAEINQIHDELKVLKNKVEDQRLSSIMAVRMILTPEQYAQFNAQMRENFPGRGRMRGKNGEGKGRPGWFPAGVDAVTTEGQ